MESFQKEITSEVRAVLERTRYEIRGPRPPVESESEAAVAATVDLDALDNPGATELPSPLAPRE